jgi:hypothetical protein
MRKDMIAKVIRVLLIATALLFVPAQPSFATNKLTLTVATNKPRYHLSDPIYVSGSLVYLPNFVYVMDWIVGIEVRDASGAPFILRSLPTGLITSQNWLVNFTQFYPCDSNGVPKYSFNAKEAVYIHAEWKNFDTTLAHPVKYGFTVYDANCVSLGYTSPMYYLLAPNSAVGLTYQVTEIPTSSMGNITIYASLFSDFLINGGYPYCPEQSATITIGTPTGNSPFELSSYGTYNFSFASPGSGVLAGKYTVYASTYYSNTLATNKATFILGLVGDVNGDGVVNILDGILLANAFMSKPGDSNWNPKADLNGDGVVNILDAILLANNFGVGG